MKVDDNGNEAWAKSEASIEGRGRIVRTVGG